MFNLPRRLPLTIRHAMDRAYAIEGISRNARITFAAVISFIDQKDAECRVFARQIKIAERAGVTDRTVRNHLRELEAAGLLVSLEQEHAQRTGFFKVTHMVLTDHGKKTVGLFTQEQQPLFQEGPQEKDTSHLVELSVPSCDSNKQDAPATPAGIVPQDLVYLADRMDSWGIFALMKKAKEHNHLLGNVAQAAKSRIETLDLHGGQAYRYLLTLIVSGACFAYTGQVAKAQEVKAQVQTVQQQEVAQAAAQWKGKTFYSLKDGQPRQRFEFERSGESVLIVDLTRIEPPRMMPLHNFDNAHALATIFNQGKLVEASRLAQSH